MPMPEPPPAAAQLEDAHCGVDIAQNAAAALNAGAAAYAISRTEPEALRPAVLNLFQAVELLLKICLDDRDPACGAIRMDKSAYFGYGTRLQAYRGVNHHVYDRVRHFSADDTT